MTKICHINILPLFRENGQQQHLKYVSADTAMEMLGVYLAPDGSNYAQVDTMIKRMTQLGEMI